MKFILLYKIYELHDVVEQYQHTHNWSLLFKNTHILVCLLLKKHYWYCNYQTKQINKLKSINP